MHYLSGVLFDITAMLLVSMFGEARREKRLVMYPWLNCPQISQPPWHSPVLRGGVLYSGSSAIGSPLQLCSKVVLHLMQTATKPLLIRVFGGSVMLHAHSS